MSYVLGAAAVIISGVSAFFAYQARKDSAASARAALASDHRARTPQLSVRLTVPAAPSTELAIYEVRNDGPADLDLVRISKPIVSPMASHQLAVTGSVEGLQDTIEFGPLLLGEARAFTLCCGAADDLPEFRVRVDCKVGDDLWTLSVLLPSPRAGSL